MSEPAATGDVASPTPVGTTGAAGAGGGAGAGGQAATAASRRAGFFGDNAAAANVLAGGAVATGTTGVRTGHTTKPLVEDKTPKEFDIPFAITEDEARGLRLLKAQVEAARGVTMPTDLRLLQFLLGRKMDVPSALKKLTKYQEVERQWALESCGLWADDTIKELQTLKMYVVPPTAGAPAVLYFHAALHLPDDFTTECTMRSFCHLIWRMLEVRRAQPPWPAACLTRFLSRCDSAGLFGTSPRTPTPSAMASPWCVAKLRGLCVCPDVPANALPYRGRCTSWTASRGRTLTSTPRKSSWTRFRYAQCSARTGVGGNLTRTHGLPQDRIPLRYHAMIAVQARMCARQSRVVCMLIHRVCDLCSLVLPCDPENGEAFHEGTAQPTRTVPFVTMHADVADHAGCSKNCATAWSWLPRQPTWSSTCHARLSRPGLAA